MVQVECILGSKTKSLWSNDSWAVYEKLGKNEVGEGRHDLSRWKEVHVKGLQQGRAHHIPGKGWGKQKEGAPKMRLQDQAGETRDFVGM